MGFVNFIIILVVTQEIFADLSSRIVNGTNAEIAEFPYLVSLRNYGSHSCAGSLIDENWILTAGMKIF